MRIILVAFVLLFILPLASCLPECFLDCELAEEVNLQGTNTSADCRCWKACEVHQYSDEVKKVLEHYEIVDSTLKKAVYIRRDCKKAIMGDGAFDSIDDLLQKMWDPDGPMTVATKEAPSTNSVSAPKDWVLLKVNYHCPIIRQTPFVRRQLRQYRLKASPGRAVYLHRDCDQIRYSSGKENAEAASNAVLKSLEADNVTAEWFLYDWSKEGSCSPLTHRSRQELRDDANKALFFEAMNQIYRRGLWHIHAVFHGQLRLYNWGHGTPGFLPWHRLAILFIEDQLRGLGEKYRCVTVPFMDWGRDAMAPEVSPIFREDTMGTITGIRAQGSCLGQQDNGCCVRDGPFAGWSDIFGTCLRRNFNEISPNRIGLPDNEAVVDLVTRYPGFGYNGKGKTLATFGVVSTVLDQCLEECGDDADILGTCSPVCHGLISTKKFRGFAGDLELSHSRVHFCIGGQMYSSYSPADPIFMLNHGFVDKIWDRWVRCQGFKQLKQYWITDVDHLADVYTVEGPYGLLDRVPGYLFTLEEVSHPEDMMYTSFSYTSDPWEDINRLNKACPAGWKERIGDKFTNDSRVVSDANLPSNKGAQFLEISTRTPLTPSTPFTLLRGMDGKKKG